MKATIILTIATLFVLTAAHQKKVVESEKLPAHPFFRTVLHGLSKDAENNLRSLWHGLSKEQKHEAVETLKAFGRGEYELIATKLRELTHEQLKDLKEELKNTRVHELLENVVSDHFILGRDASGTTAKPSGADGINKDKSFYGIIFAFIGILMSVLRH